jgi:hypothetical protein
MPKSNRKTKYTTLSEQCQNVTEKQNIQHCRNNAKIYQENKIYYTVGIMPKSNRKTKYTTLSEQCQNITKYTTLSEQCQNLTEKQNILHCRNNAKI